jgi:hypothetical protein
MAEPLLNRAKVADEIDLVRRLVEVSGMAAADFLPDPRATALQALLDLVDDRLSALSETVLPGGGE